MKAAIFFAVVCCLSVALISAKRRKCDSNPDCGEGECCMQLYPFGPKLCKSLRQEGEYCFMRDSWNERDGYHMYLCPCGEGLSCEAKEIKQEGDFTQYINTTCVAKKEF